MTEPIQPIVPEGTPLPTPPVGVPPYPITPFAVWTWSTPVIPEFYWNVYSAEQRIKQICKEIGRIEAYLNYLTNKVNENVIELHKRIDQLTERVAALEEKLKQEVARLDALIAQLRADLEQEIADREAGDEALGDRIDQEIVDRTHGDQTLHEEISAEATARTHADDALHQEISTETQARIHADDELHEEITHRLLPTDVQAGDEISITRPDPESNTIVIASTVSHSLAELQALVSGLQAALTSETEERRADDTALWTAVNNRIERGKILAGSGIKVENDPDSSTVTISATGGGTGGGSTTVAGTAPVEVTGDPEEGYTVSVAQATEEEAGVISEARVRELAPSYTAGDGIAISGNRISISPSGVQTPFTQGVNKRVVANIVPSSGAQSGKVSSTIQFEPGTGISLSHNGAIEISAKTATESAAGIISEARVKELAGGVAPSLSAESPLSLEDGTISLTKDPEGPVTSSESGLSVREITPETESETETGVVSKGTIKTLASAYAQGVKLAGDGGGWTDPFRLLPEDTPGGVGGSIVLKNNLISDSYTVSSGLESDLADGKIVWFRNLGSVNNEFITMWLPKSLEVEVTTDGSTWTDPDQGSIYNVSFELVITSRSSGYADIGVRLTERGRFFMEQEHWTGAKFHWSVMPICFGYYYDSGQ